MNRSFIGKMVLLNKAICFSLLLILMLNMFSKECIAQSGTDFIVIDLENTHQISAIEISPDRKTMAIGTAGGLVILWDIATQKVIRRIEISGYPWGPYMHYSVDGNYLLLIQQFFTDFSLNKDRPSRVEVLDVASGKILLSKDGVNSATFGPDSKSIAGLKEEMSFSGIS